MIGAITIATNDIIYTRDSLTSNEKKSLAWFPDTSVAVTLILSVLPISSNLLGIPLNFFVSISNFNHFGKDLSSSSLAVYYSSSLSKSMNVSGCSCNSKSVSINAAY